MIPEHGMPILDYGVLTLQSLVGDGSSLFRDLRDCAFVLSLQLIEANLATASCQDLSALPFDGVQKLKNLSPARQTGTSKT